VASLNEAANIERCLIGLEPVDRVFLVDSGSTDGTCEVAESRGVEVVQFDYRGSYPKKRQWAMENLDVTTPWTLLIDADEFVPKSLWSEIECELRRPTSHVGYLVTKGFHFLGRRLRFGGFSHSAVLLFRTGHARFEKIVENDTSGLDMEVHERLIVDGSIGRLRNPLVHEDFKGLEAYIERHDRYSTWEAQARLMIVKGHRGGGDLVRAKPFGNLQERRRFLKWIAMWIPFEPSAWFIYHYFLRLGFLEGKAGLVASQIRRTYIRQSRSKFRQLVTGSLT
jgi:glycosyltransferase involved in cell wall biosynthesis